jgi:hypothetical protein
MQKVTQHNKLSEEYIVCIKFMIHKNMFHVSYCDTAFSLIQNKNYNKTVGKLAKELVTDVIGIFSRFDMCRIYK